MNRDSTITKENQRLHRAVAGCLWGTAVGDGMGLPYEGMSARRQRRLYGQDVGRYRFFLGRGMGSDDTEHTIHGARALLASGGDPKRFRSHLAWSLRWWILAFPPGVGKASALGCLRLWLGFPPDRSGVWSAGNGPAMRSALLGVVAGLQMDRMRELVSASTRLTHTDPLAETGALLVAAAAASPLELPEVLDVLGAIAQEGGELWQKAFVQLADSLNSGQSTGDFASRLGQQNGVSGFILHTVPVALHAALSSPTVEQAVVEAIRCGGDTDTTAAIAGAVSGARLGPESIPDHWRERWMDWPVSASFLDRTAVELTQCFGTSHPPMPRSIALFPWLLVPVRNLFFLGVVLIHLVRRALPPW